MGVKLLLLHSQTYSIFPPRSRFGVRTVILTEMMVDLYLYLVFYAVFVIGFALALIGLSESAPRQYSAFGFMVHHKCDSHYIHLIAALSCADSTGAQHPSWLWPCCLQSEPPFPEDLRALSAEAAYRELSSAGHLAENTVALHNNEGQAG